METLTLLVAPVSDTISNQNAHTITVGDFGMFMFCCILVYLGISFVAWFLNKLLKHSGNDCKHQNTMAPIAHIACIICMLIQFFKPSTWKSYRKHSKTKRDKKEREKAEHIMQRIKERTKGLTDI